MNTHPDPFNEVLTEDVRDMLSHVYEPKIVATAKAHRLMARGMDTQVPQTAVKASMVTKAPYSSP